MQRLDKAHPEHRTGRDNKGDLGILAPRRDELPLHRTGRQQGRKRGRRSIEALGARIQHDQLVARAGEGVVPAQGPWPTREGTTAAKGGRQAEDLGDRLLVRLCRLSAPGLDGSEQGATRRPIKLIWRIAPGLEERIGQERVADHAAPQRARQDSPAPGAIQEPIVRHIVIVTDCICRDVRQRPTHLGQGRPKVAQPRALIRVAGLFFLQ